MSEQGGNWRDPANIKAAFEDAKRNAQRLESCPGPHDFAVKGPIENPLRQRYACIHCLGEVGRTEYIWYGPVTGDSAQDFQSLQAFQYVFGEVDEATYSVVDQQGGDAVDGFGFEDAW